MKSIYYFLLVILLCTACQNKNKTVESELSTFIEKNEIKLEQLRNWDIYFERERYFWSCRHWYNKDSLLSHLLLYVDKNNNVSNIGIGLLNEDDTIFVKNMAMQNVAMLYDLMQLNKFDGIGTHEAFSESLYFDYCINLRKKEEKFQLMHMKNNSHLGEYLYGKWRIRKIN